MSPRVPGGQPSFTREQALLVAEAAGFDLDKPLRGQLDDRPLRAQLADGDAPGDSLAQRLDALDAKLDALAGGQGTPAVQQSFAEGLAGKLAEAQSDWFTPGGEPDAA